MANESYIWKNSEFQIVSETNNLRKNITKMDQEHKIIGFRTL
jgi:hypothetical protein